MFKTADCEIDFSTLPANFGVGALTTFDANLTRPYQLTYNAGITHEVARGMWVAEWFHSDFKNLIARNNVARTAADYTLVTVANPLDGSAIAPYNVSAAKLLYLQPSVVLQGRIIRVGIDVKW